MSKKDDFTQMELDKLAKRIRQLRIEKGYSNYENFAFDHDIPRAQYGRYENREDLRYSSLMKVINVDHSTKSEEQVKLSCII